MHYDRLSDSGNKVRHITLYLRAVKPVHDACSLFPPLRSSRLSVFPCALLLSALVVLLGPWARPRPMHDILPTPSSSSLPGSTSMSHGGHHVCSAALNIFFYERDMYILKPRANTKTKEE